MMTQEQIESIYLADTMAMIIDNPNHSPEGLKSLLDDMYLRLKKLYRHEVRLIDIDAPGESFLMKYIYQMQDAMQSQGDE